MARSVAQTLIALVSVASSAVAADAPVEYERLQHPTTTWTERDGLPSAHMYAIGQDAAGYLWLGTSAGLIQFDGVQFRLWKPPEGVELGTTIAMPLYSSRDGSLWMGMGPTGGIGRLQGGRFTTYAASHGLPATSARALLEDAEGTMWAGGAGFLVRLRGDRWEAVRTDLLPAGFVVRSIYQDVRRSIWIGGSFGLLRYEPGARTMTSWSSTPTGVIAGTPEGAIWTLESGRLSRKYPTASQSADHGLIDARALNLLGDRRGRLWMGQPDGSFLRAETTSDGRLILRSLPRQSGMRHDGLASLFEDREGNVWIGSDRGLCRVSPEPSIVQMRPEFRETMVNAVAAGTNGAMWVATNAGLARVSGGQTRWFTTRDGLPGDIVRSIHVRDSNTVWAVTRTGLARLVNGRFEPLGANIRLPDFTTLATDANGDAYMLFRGLSRFSRGRLATLDGSLRSDGVSAAMTDSRGRVWFGFSAGGVTRIEGDRFGPVESPPRIAAARVNSILEDRSGAIWVSTERGVGRLRAEPSVSITRENGLPGSGSVTGVIEDDQGALWLGTNNGILRVGRDEIDKLAANPRHQLRYRLIDAYDGLAGGALWAGHPSSALSKDGTLWFVTTGGVAVIDARRPSRPPVVPPLRVERVAADGQSVAVVPQAAVPALTSRLEIDYSAVSFATPQRTRFRYRLEGYDTTWVDAGASRHAVFTNLPPRDYKFVVNARTLGGDWSEATATWDFAVAPAFYQRGLFRAAVAGAVGLLIWAVWRMKQREHRRQMALVLAERTRLSREIHDTLLQGMAGTALHLGFISQALSGSSRERIAHELQDARNRLESYIRETRQKIWDLRSQWLVSNDFPAALREVARHLSIGDATKVEVQVVGRPRSAPPAVEEQTLKIAQEAITNAVRHAGGSAVHVEAHFGLNDLRLRVADTGAGVGAPAIHSDADARWGLIGMKERAERIGATLALSQSAEGGTELVATVPW